MKKKTKKIRRKKRIKRVKKTTRQKSRRVGTIRRAKKAKKLIRKKHRRLRKKPRKKQARRKPIKRKARKIKRAKKHRKRFPKRRRKPIKRIKRHRRRIVRRRARKKYSAGSSLEQLFESPAKVQIMKLFFRNPETNFLVKEAKKKLRINLATINREMDKLEKIGLLKTRQISARKRLFSVNPNFDFFNELRDLILKSSPVPREKILKAVRGLGRIRLALLSGLLVGNPAAAGSRADLLIVGDNINSRKLNTFIKNLESEAGTDIRCVAMTTEEFAYRYDMYDRFIRDLLGEKGEFLINKLGL